MNWIIREAREEDREAFVSLSLELARFNRSNHDPRCTFDDFGEVLRIQEREALETFEARGENRKILLAELEGRIVGYALGKVIEAEEAADNGGGESGFWINLF